MTAFYRSSALLRISRLFAAFLPIVFPLIAPLHVHAQWLDWTEDTDNRLVLSSVATTDPEEKDIWAADFNNDGWDDVIVVRKAPFSNAQTPPKTTLLLMNVNGVLTDLTAQFAPEFLSNPTFGRDVYAADFDSDGWIDVVIANTFNQQPMYYRNLGQINGVWQGFVDESATRFPLLTEDVPLFCAVWAGDLNGNGALDLYFCNYKFNAAGGIAQDYLLINDGTGHFTNESQARLGNLRNSAFGTAVQLHDIDQDGDLDVLKVSTLYGVEPWNGLGLLVLFNNGDGTFTNWQNIQAGSAPYMFEVVDLDQDGWLDIYVVDDGADRVLYITGSNPDNSLTFTQTTLNYTATGGFGGNVHATDLDLDGFVDVAIADVDVDIPPCDSGRRMAIYRNENGAITNPYGNTAYPWADNTYDFFFLDINNDGLQDIITGNCSGYKVFMSANCELAPNNSDFDGDGLPDACDPCPNNPDPDCAPPTDFPTTSLEFSMARQWNDLALGSIRRDFARPTVHARNLFHLSIAQWDAWSAYNPASCNYLLGQSLNGFTCAFDGFALPQNIEAARDTAIAFASYRLLRHRFANSPQAALLYEGYDVHMGNLGFDINFTSTDYTSGSAAALGNYIAQCVIAYGLEDNSNEQNDYANNFYAPVNEPMNVAVAGNENLSDFNRWQPLTLALFIDQSGNLIPGETPQFLSPEWGHVHNFSFTEDDVTINTRDGNTYPVYVDPGAPPMLQMDGSGTSDDYKWSFLTTAIWSSHLDPSDGVMWDISPGSIGNNAPLPSSFQEHPNYYDQFEGGNAHNGHPVNPVTGLPYAPNMVPRADYARVLAEFWADGPDSETPPGHWFSIFNYVSDHPLVEKRIQGEGPIVGDLEWDVKGYLAMGGAMHDAAVAAWSVKGWYDFLRPISAIRGMAELGQSSLPGESNYHPAGLPLIPDYVEVVQIGDPLAGAGNINVGKIKIKSWRGHNVINNVDTDIAGVDWILAEKWEPYQRPSFVTPPFAGYVSGHSTFSRAAAELMTRFTGSAYFPGGLGEFVAPANEFLVFENGPSVDVVLQWATYQDAADESAASRIWGGIHPPCDDIPGRQMGLIVGNQAFEKALEYFEALACEAPQDCAAVNLDLNAVCEAVNGTVNTTVEVTFTLNEVYCSAETLCYREDGAAEFTCIDFDALGVLMNTGSTYTVSDLLADTAYEFYFTVVDFATSTSTSPIATVVTGNCTSEIAGCTNPVSVNYNPNATLDDGSCIFNCPVIPPVCVDVNSAAYIDVISTLNYCCNTVWDAGCQMAYDALAGTCTNGCTNPTACNFDPNATVDDGSCLTAGCTNPDACNYNPEAVCDDGSCTTTITWHIDLDGDGYGTSDQTFDGSCDSPCNGQWVINIQSNGWMDETTWTFRDSDDNLVASGGPYGDGGDINTNGTSYNGPFTFFIETQGQFNDNTPNWTISTNVGLVVASGGTTGGSTLTVNDIDCLFAPAGGDCDDANPAVNPGMIENLCNGIDDNCDGLIDPDTLAGCIDAMACNYNPNATCDDASCEYLSCLGCTDETACNFNSDATQDDGSCEYESCTGCLGDLNGDGNRDVTDMLMLLAQFGCTDICSSDLNGDGFITSADMIIMLSVFGTPCP